MATWQEFLSSSPQVCGGEICATGTRIPVTVILDSLAEGATRDEVLASYPSLRVDHITAALAYAAELAHEERLGPIRAMCSSSLTRTSLWNWRRIFVAWATIPTR